MTKNEEKNIIRKHLAKECREGYTILSEDEKKAIVWDNETPEHGISYMVDKGRKVVMVLIPLYHDISFIDNSVIARDKLHGGFESRFESNGMWWREYCNQVVELERNSNAPTANALYKDFFGM